MWCHHGLEGLVQALCDGDGVPLDYEVDVNGTEAQKQVPDVSADGIDGVRCGRLARRLKDPSRRWMKVTKARELHVPSHRAQQAAPLRTSHRAQQAAPLLSPWVVSIVDSFQVCPGDMGVDLSRRDIGVPQHHLDRSEIGAALEEVGGKRVAERVRAYRTVDPCRPRVGAENLPQTLAGQGPTQAIQEERGARPAPGQTRPRR